MSENRTELLGKGCFAAGTPLLTPDGHKPVEQFQVGDPILSRHEDDPDGKLEVQRVEAIFIRQAQVFHLHLGGQVIGTTAEHPFYVKGKGWLPARALAAGDEVGGHDGKYVAVEEVFDTGAFETVYNVRVSEFHTYFVGKIDWGWIAWAHNYYHHIASDKSLQWTVFGEGPWTPRFQDIFAGAGMRLSDPLNIVWVTNHVGPHGAGYHNMVFRRLKDAVFNCTPGTPLYRNALVHELNLLRRDCVDPTHILNTMITR